MNELIYPISENYLAHWTVSDAIREIIQNAIDEGEFTIGYEVEKKKFVVHNKDGQINIRNLLIGESTKDGKSTIGKYGEGLKLAAHVLLRNKKNVVVTDRNNGLEFVFSVANLYDSNVLKVNWNKINVTNEGIFVKVVGITQSEFDEVSSKTLKLQEYNCVDTRYGEILTDTIHTNCIFVGGLFVTRLKNYKFGYNFRTGLIELNRDRNIPSNWDVQYYSAAMLNDVHNTMFNDIISVLENDFAEGISLNYVSSDELKNKLYDYHVEKYGKKIPISSEDEKIRYSSYGYSGNSFITAKPYYSSIILAASKFSKDFSIKDKRLSYRRNSKPIDVLNKFYMEYGHMLNEQAKIDFNQMMLISKTWRLHSTVAKDVTII